MAGNGVRVTIVVDPATADWVEQGWQCGYFDLDDRGELVLSLVGEALYKKSNKTAKVSN